jgi:hypothetical protein
VCPAALDGTAVVCRSHPPFDRPGRQPDGALPRYAPQGDRPRDGEADEVKAVFRGSFTRPGATQALLTLCSWNASELGDTALLEQAGGRWRAVAYGGYAPSCLESRRADGHDALLCHGGEPSTCDNASLPAIYLLDFRGGAERRDVLVTLPAPDVACWFYGPSDTWGTEGLRLPGGLHWTRFPVFRLADLNHDGVDDLVVEVEVAAAQPSAALDAKATAICKKGLDGSLATLLPPARRVRLEFLSDGDAMTASEATRKTLAMIEK